MRSFQRGLEVGVKGDITRQMSQKGTLGVQLVALARGLEVEVRLETRETSGLEAHPDAWIHPIGLAAQSKAAIAAL
jgi:hypothetical protein